MDSSKLFIIILATIVLTVATIGKVLRGPIGDALARRLSGQRHEPDPVLADQRVSELEGRLAEVEERLDFAERLLARGNSPEGAVKGIER